MCHVEDQWDVIEGSLHVPDPQHAHHDVVVTKMCASLAEQQLLVIAVMDLIHTVAHLFRDEKVLLVAVDHGFFVSHRSCQDAGSWMMSAPFAAATVSSGL